MSSEAKMLNAARFAVAEACHVCRKVQRDLATVQKALKDDRSPVTVADFASQAVIARALAEQLGSIKLVAEEDANELRARTDSGDTALLDAVVSAVRTVWHNATPDEVLDMIDLGNADPKRDHLHAFWTLDPIDGTKGFLRGQQYAVSLAWIENGSPIIGALGCPNLSADFNRGFDEPEEHGTMYSAIAGDGVWESRADDFKTAGSQLKRLEVSEDEPIRMCESVEAAHTSHNDSERVLEQLGEPGEPARLDSQAKYAVVARGQADLYLRLPTKKGYVERIWDHAAGSLVAIEAGCAVTDAAGNALDFSHGVGLEKNRGIVVAPTLLHGKAIGAIRDLGLLNLPT